MFLLIVLWFYIQSTHQVISGGILLHVYIIADIIRKRLQSYEILCRVMTSDVFAIKQFGKYIRYKV